MKWILVTGGAKRIGAEICLELAKKGNPILVHYRESKTEAEQIAKNCRDLGVAAECVQGEFSSHDQIVKFIENVKEKYQKIHGLINNVGNYHVGSALDTPIDQWESLFQLNLFTPTLLIQNFIEGIKETKGSIVNIGTSGISSVRASSIHPAYAAAKISLYSLTKSLAKELAADQVRVNMVSPGQLEISVTRPTDPGQAPMKRLGTAREVADAVAFLMHHPYITGQNLEVSGGYGI